MGIIKKRKTLTALAAGLIVLLALWATAGVVDYWRVCHSFERPLFAIATVTADDGGSGTYRGLGYHFVIEGNFMPEDELPGVTVFQYYLFGNYVKSGVRD